MIKKALSSKLQTMKSSFKVLVKERIARINLTTVKECMNEQQKNQATEKECGKERERETRLLKEHQNRSGVEVDVAAQQHSRHARMNGCGEIELEAATYRADHP